MTDSNVRASPSLYGTTERMRRIGSPEPRIDHSSNVRVSSIKPATARRDSWDVINKTKHMLSHNSLESLANMTETQLNTELNYARPDLDNETQRNTQYNKFALHKQQQQQQADYRRDSPDDVDRYKWVQFGLAPSNPTNLSLSLFLLADPVPSQSSHTRTTRTQIVLAAIRKP